MYTTLQPSYPSFVRDCDNRDLGLGSGIWVGDLVQFGSINDGCSELPQAASSHSLFFHHFRNSIMESFHYDDESATDWFRACQWIVANPCFLKRTPPVLLTAPDSPYDFATIHTFSQEQVESPFLIDTSLRHFACWPADASNRRQLFNFGSIDQASKGLKAVLVNFSLEQNLLFLST